MSHWSTLPPGNPLDRVRPGLRRVPVAALDGLIAIPWHPVRRRQAREKADAGTRPPPIRIHSAAPRACLISDGQHRLFEARRRGAKTIDIELSRGPDRDPGGWRLWQPNPGDLAHDLAQAGVTLAEATRVHPQPLLRANPSVRTAPTYRARRPPPARPGARRPRRRA